MRCQFGHVYGQQKHDERFRRCCEVKNRCLKVRSERNLVSTKRHEMWKVPRDHRIGCLFRKKKASLQEALNLLQSLPSESSDALTDDYFDEEVAANYFLELSLYSYEDDQEIEQDSKCSSCS
ncbi:hypothetical protein TNCV_5068911 [Trichonephila clavipes]|nr:hypothetical protein TNCV_5068911 [Trichonephila clavipes]